MKLTTKNTLTPDEAKRRAELEAIILPGLKDCIEVGSALREMSDKRLYRNTHATFKLYVEETYNVTVRRAYQLVEAAEVVASLPENVKHASHLNARQAEALAKVPKKDRVEVLKRATVHADLGKKPLTAKLIEQAAESVKPEPPKTLDAEAKKAFAGLSLPNREQELAAHFEGYRSALSHLLKDIPKDADFGLYLIEGNKFVALLSNRKQDQQNAKAYV
jgi:hypothetical protein